MPPWLYCSLFAAEITFKFLIWYLQSVSTVLRQDTADWIRGRYGESSVLAPETAQNILLVRAEQKVYNIVYSQAVTHPSTNTTQRCLTSVIGRELVLST